MDLYKIIRTLYDEKKRLDQLIESLEELKRTGEPQRVVHTRKRRGRKSMSADERSKVSERMRQYWALRRAQSRSEARAANEEASAAAQGA